MVTIAKKTFRNFSLPKFRKVFFAILFHYSLTSMSSPIRDVAGGEKGVQYAVLSYFLWLNHSRPTTRSAPMIIHRMAEKI